MNAPEPTPRPTLREKLASGEPRPFLGQGQRKKRAADARKAASQQDYTAHLYGESSSPRKMRLVADQIRGAEVRHALAILKLSPKSAAEPMLKLLKTALDTFERKSGERADLPGLYVQTVTVDGGMMLKRLRPAPQGRGYRVRKRSNHITLTLGVRTPAEKQ